MKKEFIFNEEGSLFLTEEEIIERFRGAVKEFAGDCKFSFNPARNKTYNNYYEYEDYVQMGLMELISCYEKYDVERGICFSTYFFGALAKKKLYIARELRSNNRRIENPIVSLNKDSKFGDPLEGLLFGKKDDYFNGNYGFDKFLIEKLTEEERVFLAMELQKSKNKSKTCVQKRCVEYAVEIINGESLLDVANLTKAELAVELGISRPTLNKRINNTMEKVNTLAKQYNSLEII